jgi:hypothetical protein
MNLRLSNSIVGHTLWIASNAYIQEVTSITINEKENPQDEVHLGMLKDLYLYGRKYPSNTLPKNAFKRQYQKAMWIKVHQQYFEISDAHYSPHEANNEMLANDNIGLIDEVLHSDGETCDVYINASLKPVSYTNH